MKKLIISEKWRPKTLDDIILLPSIKRRFINGLNENFIFYGSFGTGKTSLARILIGKWTKDKPYIEINSSYYTSIDTLRSTIDDFCSKVYMGFDLETQPTVDEIKYVFLDEFERTSKQYQDALKAYIDEYSSKNVRFILVTNHLNKISEGILSRFKTVNFNAQTKDQERELKREIFKRVKKILSSENIEISKEDLIKIINKKFPDIRSILLSIDEFKHNGELLSDSNVNDSGVKLDLYSILYDSSKTDSDIYYFLMEKFGQDNILEMILLLGKPLIDWIISEKPEDVTKLFEISYVVSDYSPLLENNLDPIILAMTVVGKIRNILI